MNRKDERILVWCFVLWLFVAFIFDINTGFLDWQTQNMWTWDIYSWYVTQEKYDELKWWYDQQTLDLSDKTSNISSLSDENYVLRRDIEAFVNCPHKWKSVYVLEYREEYTPVIVTWNVLSCARDFTYVDSDWDGYGIGYKEVYQNKKELLNSL